jgi:hypothetical protein
VSLETAQGKDGGDEPPRLPPNGVLTAWAAKELAKLKPVPARAALFETFGRRCLDRHLPREDEPLPLGKGRSLRSIRATLEGSEFRLIYAQVRPVKSGGQAGPETAVAVSVEALPVRFVGLVAWAKKRARVGDKGELAWRRSELWLAQHPDYRRG